MIDMCLHVLSEGRAYYPLSAIRYPLNAIFCLDGLEGFGYFIALKINAPGAENFLEITKY